MGPKSTQKGQRWLAQIDQHARAISKRWYRVARSAAHHIWGVVHRILVKRCHARTLIGIRAQAIVSFRPYTLYLFTLDGEVPTWTGTQRGSMAF